MSISPVDMQVMITKTTEVASKHSAQLHKATADQVKIVEEETQRQEDNTKKVHDRSTTEKIYVDEEENNKKQKEKDNKKSNTKEDEDDLDEEPKTLQERLVGQHFDTSI